MTKKILIVDFDLSSLEQLQDMLEDELFEISTATSGELAWDMLTSQHFDLVVSEIVLPRLHGFQLSQAIAEQLPHCRSIIVSGVFKGDLYRHQALHQFQAGGYFEKPVEKVELKKSVATLLDIPEDELSGVVEEVIEEVAEEVEEEVAEEVVEEVGMTAVEETVSDVAVPLESEPSTEPEMADSEEEHEIIIEFSEHSPALEESEQEQTVETQPEVIEDPPPLPKKEVDIDSMLKVDTKDNPGNESYKKIDSEISRKIEDALSDLGIKM